MDEDELEGWFQSVSGGKPKSTAAAAAPAQQRPQTLAPPGGPPPASLNNSTTTKSSTTKNKFDLFADDLIDGDDSKVDESSNVISIPVPPKFSQPAATITTTRPATSAGVFSSNTVPSSISSPGSSNTMNRPKSAAGAGILKKKYDLNATSDDGGDDDINSLFSNNNNTAQQKRTSGTQQRPHKTTTFDLPMLSDDEVVAGPSQPPPPPAASTTATTSKKLSDIMNEDFYESSFSAPKPSSVRNETPSPQQQQQFSDRTPTKPSSTRKKTALDSLFDEDDENADGSERPPSRPLRQPNTQNSDKKKLNLSELGLGHKKSPEDEALDLMDRSTTTKFTGDPQAIEQLRQQVEQTQTQIKEREKIIAGVKVDFENNLRDELTHAREKQQEVMEKQRNALLQFTLVEQKVASEEELKRLNELQLEMRRLHDFHLQLLKFGGSMTAAAATASPYSALIANPVLTTQALPAGSQPHTQSKDGDFTTGSQNMALLTEAIVSQVSNVIPKLHDDVEKIFKERIDTLESDLKSRDDRISTLQARVEDQEEKTLEAKESSHKFVHQIMDEHASELQRLKELHERRLNELRTDYTAHLERLKTGYREQMESIETFVNMERTQRMQLREQLSTENKALFEVKDKLMAEKEQSIDEARADLTKRQEQFNEIIVTLREVRDQLVQERRQATDQLARADERNEQRRADYQALLGECERERTTITNERTELRTEREQFTAAFKHELHELTTARQEFVQEKEYFKQLLVEERKRMSEERELQNEYSLAALQSNLDLSKQRAELEGIKSVTAQRLSSVDQERKQLVNLQRQLQRVKQAVQQNVSQTEVAKSEQRGHLGHARHLVQMAEKLVHKASADEYNNDDYDNIDGGDRGDAPPQGGEMAAAAQAGSQLLYDNMQRNFKMLSVRHQQLAQQRFMLHTKWQRLLRDGQSNDPVVAAFAESDENITQTTMTVMHARQQQQNNFAMPNPTALFVPFKKINLDSAAAAKKYATSSTKRQQQQKQQPVSLQTSFSAVYTTSAYGDDDNDGNAALASKLHSTASLESRLRKPPKPFSIVDRQSANSTATNSRLPEIYLSDEEDNNTNDG